MLSNLDLINAAFEFGGFIFAGLNVLRLWRDRAIAGVSIGAFAFFTGWGYFNIIYYPALHQWVSVGAAALLALMNTAWVALAIYIARGNNGARQGSKGST